MEKKILTQALRELFNSFTCFLWNPDSVFRCSAFVVEVFFRAFLTFGESFGGKKFAFFADFSVRTNAPKSLISPQAALLYINLAPFLKTFGLRFKRASKTLQLISDFNPFRDVSGLPGSSSALFLNRQFPQKAGIVLFALNLQDQAKHF